MIKVNELRIGNIIKFCNLLEKERFVTVNARFFSSLAGGRSSDEMLPNDELNAYYTAITLTPEILEKCGLDTDFYDCFILCDSIFIDPKSNEVFYKYWSEGAAYGSMESNVIRSIEYLHQLQNLYFALCGEELTINL